MISIDLNQKKKLVLPPSSFSLFLFKPRSITKRIEKFKIELLLNFKRGPSYV